MKKLLMLMILPVILISCGEPDKFKKNEKVQLVKSCVGYDYKNDISVQLGEGLSGIVDYLFNNGSRTKIITEDNNYSVETDCLKSLEKPEKIEKKPEHTKARNLNRRFTPGYENRPNRGKFNRGYPRVKPAKKPATSKYEIVKEYIEFEKLCKSYGKLFRKKLEVEITEKDELSCAGKNEKQLKYDIELINQFKGK